MSNEKTSDGQRLAKRAAVEITVMSPERPDTPLPAAIPKDYESFRVWTIKEFRNLAKDLQLFENNTVERFRIANDKNEALAASLETHEHLIPPAKDTGVSDHTKIFVTHDDLQSKLSEATKAIEMSLTQMLTAMRQPEDELKIMKSQIDQYMEQLKILDDKFKGHVEGNFQVVERSYAALQHNVDAALKGLTKEGSTNNVALHLSFGQLQETVGQLTAQGVQDKETMQATLNGVINDHGALKQSLQRAQEEFARMTSSSSASGSEPCHGRGADHGDRISAVEVWLRGCRLDEFKARVEKLEQHGGDPWHGAARLSFSGTSGGGADLNAGRRGGHPQGRDGVPGGRVPNDDDGDDSDEEYIVTESFDGANLSKAFDDKVALSDKYTYDGLTGGAGWRKKVRGYWLSKCPELRPVLNWTEARGDSKITFKELKQKTQEGFWMTEVDVRRANHAIWGFLGLCLKGEASKLYELASELNGLEAWRLITRHVQKGKSIQLGTLRRAVRNPESIRKLEDVSNGITKFETTLNEYKLAGGSAPSDDDLKSDLLDTLPQEIREQLLWHSTNPEISFDKFKSHIRNMADQILFHRGKLQPVNALEDDVTNWEAECEEEVNAVLRKYGKGNGKGFPNRSLRDPRGLGGKGAGNEKGGGKGNGSWNTWKAGAAGKGEGKGEERVPKCANCGEDGHSAGACKKPWLPLEQRRCHGCGEKGHISRNCPKKQARTRAAGAVHEPESEQPAFFGCIQCAEDFQPAKKVVKPQPKGATLADFIPTATYNKFACLATKNEGRYERSTSKVMKVKEIRKITQNEPNRNRAKRANWKMCAPLTYDEDEDDDDEEDEEEILDLEEEIEIGVAADSGCVAHVVGPHDIPGSVQVVKVKGKSKNFVAANNSKIKNYGMAAVELEQDDGKVVHNNFNVADVCRPLHAVSQICDNGHDMLYKKGCAYVVPEGVFDKILAQVAHVATYPRSGGLYVAKVKVRDPRGAKSKSAGFGRPGQGR